MNFCFIDFSTEMKIENFSYLDKSDLLNLRVQCKNLKTLIDTCSKFWKEIIVPNEFNKNNFFAYLKIAKQNLKSFKLIANNSTNKPILKEWKEKSDFLLQNLNLYNPNLQILSFFGCRDIPFFEYPSSIKSLDLRG
jgi:hypothetical protein